MGARPGRLSRSTELAEAIVDLITGQDLAPGSPLPTEAQLTTDLQTSRGPLREALKALQAQGIVEVRHGYGTFVGPASAEALLPWLTFRARSAEALADLLDIRELLEIGLARRVASAGLSAEAVAELGDCVATMAAGSSGSADADRRFHQILCEAAGNELAKDLVGVFWSAYATAEPVIGERLSDASALAERHERIITALAAGDQSHAEDAVRRHFDEVRDRLRAR
jgi:DNA-binding FadR family transcriptional regulator